MTHVFAILDRSGSMGGLTKDTIGGYNTFIDKLREDKDIRVTLTLFDDHFEQPYKDVPIEKVPELTDKVYFARGMTALRDSFCKTINEGKGNVGKLEKAIVLVITDGMENSSREYSQDQMKSLVKELEDKGNWTFTYLGANQDAWSVAQNFGFAQGNVATYNATAGGTAQVYATMSMNVQGAVRSSAMNSKQFYSDKDKENLQNAK